MKTENRFVIDYHYDCKDADGKLTSRRLEHRYSFDNNTQELILWNKGIGHFVKTKMHCEEQLKSTYAEVILKKKIATTRNSTVLDEVI